jgi:hypothetical protein
MGTGLEAISVLKEILKNQKWESRVWPFPHTLVTNVFTRRAYENLESSFKQILALGLSEAESPGRLARRIRDYDAYSLNFAHIGAATSLDVFSSSEWHDLVARISGVDATGDVNAALHVHLPGSQSGTIHNDLNPGFFVDNPTLDGINVSDDRICNYRTGNGRGSARETIRAAAMIFYLGNDHWHPGDGGETGLYDDGLASIEHPKVAVPPVNNSLLIFECTPYSFHSFISNRKTRNSVILWLHRPKSTVVKRWGENSIVYWGS